MSQRQRQGEGRDHAVVIGAGMGGLAAALRLTAAGMAVTVVEKGEQPGGKMRRVPAGDGWVDAGPTVFTMREVFEEIFAEAGASLSDHVGLRAADVLARHAWDGGGELDLHADHETSVEAIARFAGQAEAKRYRQFCADAKKIHDTLEAPFLRQPSATPGSLMKSAGMADLMGIKPFTRLWDALGAYFHDARLRQLFGRYATYCGSSPFRAPATLMLVAHVEQRGVWLVDGGMHKLAVALADLLTDQGGTIRYTTEATEILAEGGRVTGVRLAGGETLAAGTVVANADVAALSSGKLGRAAARAVPETPRAERSLSALTFTLRARCSGWPMARHNVFFCNDYPAEFTDIFRRGRLPREPTVYVCAQDRDDLGPADGATPERLLLIINAPPDGDIRTYDTSEIAACEERAFALLTRCGLTLDPDRASMTATTPTDFARMFPGSGGAIYGRASHGWRASFQRPSVRTKLPGLYLGTGSAHPGPGVPMAALSGRLAAAEALGDRDSTARSRTTAMPGGTSTP